jgi:hypothetical protein
VTCTEWVRENVPVKRTVYRVECRQEQYDTCRCERVPVCKERVVCCVKKVPCWSEQTRKVCCKETVYEERMVNKTCYKTVQETCMKKQLVRMGHWECREVCPVFGGGNGGLFGGHGHHGGCNSGCGDSCGNNNNCCETCRPTRTHQHWVHCPEYRECPVTVCKKVCVTECVKCKVPVCRTTWKEEKVKVCTYQCVEEKRVEKYTCYETRQVACKATRTVRVCVPCEETVNCCRWVQKTVCRQVPCAPACNTSCNNCCERGGFFQGLHDRLHNRDCCRDSCSSGCGGGCH